MTRSESALVSLRAKHLRVHVIIELIYLIVLQYLLQKTLSSLFSYHCSYSYD